MITGPVSFRELDTLFQKPVMEVFHQGLIRTPPLRKLCAVIAEVIGGVFKERILTGYVQLESIHLGRFILLVRGDAAPPVYDATQVGLLYIHGIFRLGAFS